MARKESDFFTTEVEYFDKAAKTTYYFEATIHFDTYEDWGDYYNPPTFEITDYDYDLASEMVKYNDEVEDMPVKDEAEIKSVLKSVDWEEIISDYISR